MSPSVSSERLESAYQAARAALVGERTQAGHWVGELSTSALSTATAVSALALVQKAGGGAEEYSALIAGGMRWLAGNQNEDGGWGDTVRSLSNISTTMLCRAAFHLTGTAGLHAHSLERAEQWLFARYGRSVEELAEAVRARYGKDRTFSVPILMTSALAGLVSWREVPGLPFELACFPQAWFRYLRLPVVSYALPALIAIGQTIFYHRPPGNPLLRGVRRWAIRKSLRVLQAIQPSSGGFLEATPLTSFVTLGLVSSGQAGHPVVDVCVRFLVRSVRPDGSWPIDTNLATWVTTLSVLSLAAAGEVEQLDRRAELVEWLLGQQYRERHPYTGADPGGWAWTDLPGGVPDSDDTPGALLALAVLDREGSPAVVEAAGRGVGWLLGVQNGDGGWPTFCRGWGHLPFDRSGSDLTAHVLRALAAWQPRLAGDARLARRMAGSMARGLAYLARTQREDGCWVPLWFGCQHAGNEENPTYGTARVLAAYRDLDRMNEEAAQRGLDWLLAQQNTDGGWGGNAGTPSSMEETALALDVLPAAGGRAENAFQRGLAWLIEHVETGGLTNPTPLGFYFARLWYFEKLYPILFCVAALGRTRQRGLSPQRTHP